MLVTPPRPELRARLPRLMAGLVAVGIGAALMVRADVGLGPWDVLHQGISEHTGVPIGTVGILVGFLVLLAWIPLRERLGIGTVINMITIGVVIDLTLAVLPADLGPHGVRWSAMLGGVVVIALGAALYIGAGLGPGPRDGLMTALARRGRSIRSVRTAIEVAALAGGWMLGGTVGAGTVVFAIAIGPLIQFFLERVALPPLPAVALVTADPPPPR